MNRKAGFLVPFCSSIKVLEPALLLSLFVILYKLLNLCVPWFTQLGNEDSRVAVRNITSKFMYRLRIGPDKSRCLIVYGYDC